MAQTRTVKDYSVGIICALPLERTAVVAMLDERHIKGPPKVRGDDNSYAFGTMAGHNVVIASLGSGTYGKASAKGVSTHIKRSFPHLRFGLMVGIAGGIARPDTGTKDGDIRLGDIVVGCANGVPSIVAYDQGKENEKEFEIRSELAEPPEILLNAVSDLRSEHQLSGPTYLGHLSQMLANKRFNNRLIEEDYYAKPNKDGLFEGDKIKERNTRHLRLPSDSVANDPFVALSKDGTADYPKVFIGSIGSADTVMKDATRRDEVYKMVLDQRNAKLLCFEMEAAGIVRGWPCLVIRGICDYGDKYNNDVWQNFAAATAAAYAKDLLSQIAVEAVEEAKTVDVAIEEQRTFDKNPKQRLITNVAHNDAGTINTNSGSGVQNNYSQSGSHNRQFNAANMVWR